MLSLLKQIGLAVSLKVRQAVTSQQAEQLAAVYREDVADTIYQIDRDVEDVIVPLLAAEADRLGGVVLLAEGIGEEEADGLVLGTGHTSRTARWRLIMDPIDGTRGIMYDKRPAWCLMAAAPNRGPETTLADAVTAVMVELPTSRAYLADILWAERGRGAHLETYDFFTQALRPGRITPSRALNLLGGFGQVARFFAPGRDVLARIDDDLLRRLYPAANISRALSFEDQYISTGGQLYQALTGKDRYTADVRGRLGRLLVRQGMAPVFVCHPYDMCCALIAQEAGIELTDGYGNPFNAPMDLTSPVDWIVYASPALRSHIEPTLLSLLDEHLGG